jgi:Mu transposase-like protein
LPLPVHPFDTDVMRPVVSGKTPYVRFDRNSYSLPHTYVRRPLTLLASATTVRLVAGADEIARHARSYDTGQTIEQEAHVAGLVAATRQANPSSARDRLRLAVPAITTLWDRLAARGDSLRVHTARVLALLDDYGPHELAVAVTRALERDALGAGAIAHILETRRRQRGQKPPIPLALPDRPGVRDLDVTPHRLETYDELTRSDPDDAE